MSEQPKTCEVCESNWSFVWTDAHGVAQCCRCGASYRIIHYDADDKREDKPPSCTLNDKERAAVKRFYDATGRPIPAQALGLSFPGGQSAASRSDEEVWVAYRLEEKAREACDE